MIWKRKRIETSSSEGSRRDAHKLDDLKKRPEWRRTEESLPVSDIEGAGSQEIFYQHPTTVEDARWLKQRMKEINRQIGEAEYDIKHTRGRQQEEASRRNEELLQERELLRPYFDESVTFLREGYGTQYRNPTERKKAALRKVTKSYNERRQRIIDGNYTRGDSKKLEEEENRIKNLINRLGRDQ